MTNYTTDVLTGSSTAIGSNYITSLSTVCSYLNYSLTGSATGLINTIIGWVSDEIERYIELPIASQQFYGLYDGDGDSELYLNNYPIISVSSIKYRNNPTESFTNIITNGSIATNCLIYPYKLHLYNYYFNCGNKNIEVIYNAGYAIVPKELEKFATEKVVISFKESNTNVQGDGSRLGISSKNIGSGSNSSVNYIDLTDRDKRILDKYKKR